MLSTLSPFTALGVLAVLAVPALLMLSPGQLHTAQQQTDRSLQLGAPEYARTHERKHAHTNARTHATHTLTQPHTHARYTHLHKQTPAHARTHAHTTTTAR